MPRLTKNEWKLVQYACNHLWEALDITDFEIKERNLEIYKQNEKDKKTLERIINKIREVEK